MAATEIASRRGVMIRRVLLLREEVILGTASDEFKHLHDIAVEVVKSHINLGVEVRVVSQNLLSGDIKLERNMFICDDFIFSESATVKEEGYITYCTNLNDRYRLRDRFEQTVLLQDSTHQLLGAAASK